MKLWHVIGGLFAWRALRKKPKKPKAVREHNFHTCQCEHCNERRIQNYTPAQKTVKLASQVAVLAGICWAFIRVASCVW